MRSAPATPTNNRDAAASLRENLKRSHTEDSSGGQKKKKDNGEE